MNGTEKMKGTEKEKTESADDYAMITGFMIARHLEQEIPKEKLCLSQKGYESMMEAIKFEAFGGLQELKVNRYYCFSTARVYAFAVMQKITLMDFSTGQIIYETIAKFLKEAVNIQSRNFSCPACATLRKKVLQ